MKTAVVAVSDSGASWARLIAEGLGEADVFRPRSGELEELSARLFREYRGIIFVSAVGIALRMIAPHIRSKHQDPAVLAMDDAGRTVVSLLSGHEGGANMLAYQVAALTGADPVITTASEANKTLSLGIGCRRGVEPREVEEAVMAALGEYGVKLEEVRIAATTEHKKGEAGLREACRRLGLPLLFFPDWKIRRLRDDYAPSPAARRNLDLPGVSEPCALLGGRNSRLLGPRLVRGSVTVALAREAPVVVRTTGPDASPAGKYPGSPGSPAAPAEASADASGLAAASESAGTLVSAAASKSTTASESADLPGAREPARGSLLVVGIGPGSSDLLAPRARRSIREADLVVGYPPYLRLLGGILEGKKTYSTGMRREEERTEKALAAAREGARVVLVSSGDAGIYGLAGLALETLAEEDLRNIDFQVIPGITAASSCAALLGAPLVNDFAVVSLSDLLTPRKTIEERIRAAAAGDLVLVLYNPRSRRRRDLLEWTRDRLLEARGPEVPVGIVRDAGRPAEKVRLSNLGELPDLYREIDMTTTLIIGNSRSRRKGPFIVTPRGYKERLTSPPENA